MNASKTLIRISKRMLAKARKTHLEMLEIILVKPALLADEVLKANHVASHDAQWPESG